jgi:hypothetical protein
MADDDLDEDFDPDAIEEDIDEEVDPEAIDPDVIDDDDEIADVDIVSTDELVEEEVEVAVVPAEPAARKKKAEEEEEDEDEDDPDDVEADLDTILKDRIAAADEDEEDDEELEVAPRVADTPDGVVPKRANEFMCLGCFLLVNRGQFGPENNLQCPVGESECPAMETILQSGPVARPKAAKSGRKR